MKVKMEGIKMQTRKDFTKLIDNMNLKIGVEIGVGRGRFSRYLLRNSNLCLLYSIDCWKKFEGDFYVDERNDSQFMNDIRYFETIIRLWKFRLGSNVIIRMMSKDAIELFKDNSLDFVYIDANHSYEKNLMDIKKWYKKIRKGGILSGHDYVNGTFGVTDIRVKDAVDDFVKENKLKLNVTKEKEFPSWWLVKRAY